MGKEKVLKKLIGKVAFQSGDLLTQSECYECMQEYADQEKEKVAVAFAEWKDRSVLSFHTGYQVLGKLSKIQSHSDLYQYFITNVYNK